MAEPLMRAGVIVSASAHAALIAWGLLSLSPTPLDSSSIEQIPVDFVEFADETKLTKGIQTAALVEDVPPPAAEPAKPIEEPPPLPKPEPKPEPAPAEPAPQPEPPPLPPPELTPPDVPLPDPTPPPPDAAPPPTPSPVAEAPLEETAAPPLKDVPMPRVRPKAPAKPKATSDIDQITAVLEERKLAEMAALEPSDQPTTPTKPPTGAPTATQSNARMTANELDALRARLVECWSPPLGWTDPAQVRVVLMLDLNRDGSVEAARVLESPQGQYSNAAPESAARAVRRCAPYNLPADKYDAWKQVRVTFDPKDMGAL